MTASGDATDDPVPDPAFGPGHVQRLTGDVQVQRGSDLLDVAPGDGDQAAAGRPAAEDAGAEDGSAEQRDDHRRRLTAGIPVSGEVADLDVVHRGDGHVVA